MQKSFLERKGSLNNMSWYLEKGKENDVVFSSKIKFVRNIKGIPFKTKMNENDINNLLEKVKFIVPSLGYNLKFFKLSDMDEITIKSLNEKNLLSIEMISDDLDKKAIIVNDEENICITVNEDDHIGIEVFSPGFDMQNTLNLAIEIDKKLDEQLGFSCSKKYGYLTVCPTNVGTGLKASVIVHLPALKETKNVSKILNAVSNFGMTINKCEEDFYEISNIQTLGITENQIVTNLESITKKVIEQERIARKYLCKNSVELTDKVCRAYGILTNAIKITQDEIGYLLSSVKLGVDLGLIDKIDDLKVKKLILYTKEANLQKYISSTLNVYEQNLKRAEIIKQIINEK